MFLVEPLCGDQRPTRMDTRLMNRAAILVTVVIASAVLAGCSGVGDSATPGSSQSRSASPSAPADSSASADPSGPPSSTEPVDPGTSPSRSQGAPGASEDITVTGAVEGGVEMNCLLLKTTATTYLLIGGDRSKLVVGRRVTVRGRVEQGLISTCQQGTPLRVSDIQAG